MTRTITFTDTDEGRRRFKLITTYGWSVQWMPTAVEDAIDALDFVDASPEAK